MIGNSIRLASQRVPSYPGTRWYFRDPHRWRAYLEGRARGYVFLRQALRHARTLTAVGYKAAVPHYN